MKGISYEYIKYELEGNPPNSLYGLKCKKDLFCFE